MTLDKAIETMREVTRIEFFAHVGKMDCHPVPMGKHGADDYRSDWWRKEPRAIIGISYPDVENFSQSSRYFLVKAS